MEDLLDDTTNNKKSDNETVTNDASIGHNHTNDGLITYGRYDDVANRKRLLQEISVSVI